MINQEAESNDGEEPLCSENAALGTQHHVPWAQGWSQPHDCGFLGMPGGHRRLSSFSSLSV